MSHVRTAIVNVSMTESQNQEIDSTVKRERKKLFRFIRDRVRTDEEAEDILQDVFYQLVESYRLMRPIEQMSSWLFTVARNKITDRYRKKQTGSLEDIAVHRDDEGEPLFLSDLLRGTAEDGESMMTNELIMDTIMDALEELPSEQREVFVMHELEDKSFREIAEITGAGQNTLLSRKRYAVLFLRERLQSLYDEL
ncbi:MAG TPA: sigma-70 family RNA polymerase sigma factor [Flavobacteriales bacterium]|nr:sigma-70 family RNA polymerase sigma factor [Flavobacteriales bacterium]HRE96342.1 sigma-70 family RNA polymerase sigma factor [Flavobacteriales bacterium]HRJ36959.1 sigma-70 family RNA polymerase sigma factor [Flavobacteriales bacterium]HRJ37827.1 sigma-70 family RNA polymerase sigma factor [Flavobacteriales bacterium]